MVMRSLSIAATGMNAQQTNLDVIANNIANINTTGYKRSRAEFTDLMYIADKAAGVPNMMNQAITPEGAYVGMGVKTAAIRKINIQGSMIETNNSLDVAINGRGYFQIEDPDGNIFYTRSGAFNLNEGGQLVTLDGNLVADNIVIDVDIGKNAEITLGTDGTFYYKVDGAVAPVEAGQLTLVNFINEAGLEPVGNNLFRETVASGAPVAGVAGEDTYGTVKQGYLEASNVDPVREITDMIAAQRAYEMNSKVIQAADQMSAVVSQNLR